MIFETTDGSDISDEDVTKNRVYKLNGRIPLVVTQCDRYVAEDPPPFDQNERVYGTITEQSFDVVITDKTKKKIYFVRIGARAKFEGESVEVREFFYGDF